MLEMVRLWGKGHLERARAWQPDDPGHALNCLAVWD